LRCGRGVGCDVRLSRDDPGCRCPMPLLGRFTTAVKVRGAIERLQVDADAEGLTPRAGTALASRSWPGAEGRRQRTVRLGKAGRP
jgi:hypothetical protein